MAADTESAVFAVIGALGGVAISGVIGIVTAILAQRWQVQGAERDLLRGHAKQLRQERREMYALYWTAWNGLIRSLDELCENPTNSEIRARVAAGESKWLEAVDALLLICGQEVLDACIQHLRVTRNRIAAAQQGKHLSGEGRSIALNKAMRKDILDPESIVFIEAARGGSHLSTRKPKKAMA